MPSNSITVNRETTASNPGNARVNALRWAWYYPKWPLIWVSTFAINLFAVFAFSRWFLLPLVPVLGLNALYWVRVKEHFRYGDTNPGLVISINPILIAVATDLTQGVGSYPAVKIFRARSHRVMGVEPQIGIRLPTVALYTRSHDPKCPHWSDFDPRPLEFATGNKDVLDRAMASFSEADWHRLESAIQQLSDTKPGLYLLDATIASVAPKQIVFAKISDDISPTERTSRYEEPLDQDLRDRGLGSVTGGGTMLNKQGDTMWVGLDIELVNLDSALEFTRNRLRELGAPPGSLIEYRIDGQTHSLDINDS
jgi:hypothetical protein